MNRFALSGLLLLLSGQSATPPTEVDALTATILKRVLEDPTYLPGKGFRGEPPFRLLSRIGGQAVWMDPRLLPEREKWALGAKRDFDRAARAANEPVSFITIQAMTIAGTRATVEVGYALAVPPKFIKSCCCIATDEYEKGPKLGWTFIRRVGTRCS